MRTQVLEPIGVNVTELAAGDLSDRTAGALAALLSEHGVLVLPDQPLDDAAFHAFLRSFGPLMRSIGETPVPGFPDLNVISNVGRATPPRSTFHVDTSYVSSPPAYTALRAVEVPARGGETLFTNQYLAYDTLTSELRHRVAGRTIRHVVTGVALGPDDESAAEHPVFRPHPVTGRPTLYLTTPARCASVSGMSTDEAAATVDALYEHSTRAENTLRHSWSPGDLVMWDNGCVLHRAEHAGVVGDRVMHRGMVARYFGAAAA